MDPGLPGLPFSGVIDVSDDHRRAEAAGDPD